MKLVLADDHTLFRDALAQYLERAEPGAEIHRARDLYEVFEYLRKLPTPTGTNYPDLVLLDLKMPGMNGMDGFKRMRDEFPEVPLALMSGIAEPEDVQRAMDLGAMGYFPKTMSGRALVKAIQLVVGGDKYLPIDPDTNNLMPSYYGSPAVSGLPGRGVSLLANGLQSNVRLTPREQEVLTYLIQGQTNKDIARSLELQVVTVKLHVRGICRKLGASNRTQAALRAREMGLSA